MGHEIEIHGRSSLSQAGVTQKVLPNFREIDYHCSLRGVEWGKGPPGPGLGLAWAQHLRRYPSRTNSLSPSSVHLGPFSDSYICMLVIKFLPRFCVFQMNICVDACYTRVVNIKVLDILIFVAEPWLELVKVQEIMEDVASLLLGDS